MNLSFVMNSRQPPTMLSEGYSVKPAVCGAESWACASDCVDDEETEDEVSECSVQGI
jgi:hypothetical protein